MKREYCFQSPDAIRSLNFGRYIAVSGESAGIRAVQRVGNPAECLIAEAAWVARRSSADVVKCALALGAQGVASGNPDHWPASARARPAVLVFARRFHIDYVYGSAIEESEAPFSRSRRDARRLARRDSTSSLLAEGARILRRPRAHPHPPAGGRGDGPRAVGGGAPTAGAGCALWQRDPRTRCFLRVADDPFEAGQDASSAAEGVLRPTENAGGTGRRRLRRDTSHCTRNSKRFTVTASWMVPAFHRTKCGPKP
jgi:hypothetical protein